MQQSLEPLLKGQIKFSFILCIILTYHKLYKVTVTQLEQLRI